MSSVRICEPNTMPQALAVTAPAISPASGPRHRHQSAADRITRMNPVADGHTRADHSSITNVRKTSAVIQY